MTRLLWVIKMQHSEDGAISYTVNCLFITKAFITTTVKIFKKCECIALHVDLDGAPKFYVGALKMF